MQLCIVCDEFAVIFSSNVSIFAIDDESMPTNESTSEAAALSFILSIVFTRFGSNWQHRRRTFVNKGDTF
jgi:hypothetical protein